MDDLIQITEPLKNNNLLNSDFDISGYEYYRYYSFIDIPFSLELNIIEQETRKENILQYTSNNTDTTKNKQYANKVRGISQHRKKAFASQTEGKQTNPNSLNLIRVNKNKMIINETPYIEVPYIKTTLPYNQELNNIYTDGNMIDTTSQIPENTNNIVVIPFVENRTIPENENILDGGVLYAGTKYIPEVIMRDHYNPSLYTISEKAIVSSSFAEHFKINVELTYTDEELQQITGKTIKELYPYLPSWEKDNFYNGVIWSPENGGNFGTIISKSTNFPDANDFLPSMYNLSNNYKYDLISDTYFPTITKIIWFKPNNIPDEYGYIEPLKMTVFYNKNNT